MTTDSALAAVRAAAQAATTAAPAADTAQPSATEAAQTPAAQAPATTPPATTPASSQQAAGGADQVATARAEGQKEGAKAERQRLSAILKLDSAKERQSQALSLALDTDVTAEQADAVLKASAAGGKANSFETAMARIGNPALGTNVPAGTKPKPALDHAGIYQRYNNPGAK